MKKYLKDLEAELKKHNLSEEEIKEVLADHQEMIESAKKEGLTDEELEAKFGNPKDVAEELADFSEKQEEKKKVEPNRDGKKREFVEIDDNYTVKISLINEDIKVKTHEEDSIIVEFVGKIKEEKYNIGYIDKTFTLSRNKDFERSSYFDKNSKRKFIVYLPKSKSIDSFAFKVINGDGAMKGIFSSEFKIGTNNGDIKLKEITSKSLAINTVNGDLSLDTVNSDEFKISLISGDIKAKDITVANDISVNTVSGDINLLDVTCDTLALRTVSGDVLGKEFYPNSVKLTTVSGDIKIINSKETNIKILQKKAVSGDVRIMIK